MASIEYVQVLFVLICIFTLSFPLGKFIARLFQSRFQKVEKIHSTLFSSFDIVCPIRNENAPYIIPGDAARRSAFGRRKIGWIRPCHVPVAIYIYWYIISYVLIIDRPYI